MGTLPDRQLVQRWHGITIASTKGSGGLIGENDASNQDLRCGARSKADAGTSKLEQTRSATAENLQSASRGDSHLRQPGNPRAVSAHLRDVSPVAFVHRLQR